VPLVVVYGPNESGKSTYIDLAITLLSNLRDAQLLARHGSIGEQLAGYIAVEHDDTNLQISFSETAKVMERYTGHQGWREFSPKNSDIEKMLSNLDEGIVRNLFRVDSVEIVASALLPKFSDESGANSQEIEKGVGPTKQRFISYASGGGGAAVDFAGLTRDMRDKAEKLISRQNMTTGIAPLRSQRTRLKEQLSAAQMTQSRYLEEKSRLEGLQRDVDENRKLQTDLERRKRCMSFVRGFTDINSKAEAARREIDELSASRLLVPEGFAALVNVFESKISELRDLPLARSLGDLARSRENYGEENAKSAASLNALGIDSEATFKNADWHIDSERLTRVTEINRRINQRDSFLGQVPEATLIELAGKSARLETAVKNAEQHWERAGTGLAPEAYIASLAAGQIVVPQPPNPGKRSAYSLVIGGVATTIAAIPLGVTWQGGLVGLVALALIGLGIRDLVIKPTLETSAGVTASDAKSTDLFVLANDVMTASRELGTHRAERSGIETQRSRAMLRATEIDKELSDLLAIWGLPKVAGLTVDGAASLSESLKAAADAISKCDSIRLQVDQRQRDVDDCTTEFKRHSEDIDQRLKQVGHPVDVSILTSPAQLADALRELVDEYRRQEGLRTAIAEKEQQLRSLPDEDRPLVKEFLEKDQVERDKLDKSFSSESQRLEATVLGQQSEIARALSSIEKLESSSSGASIRLQITSIDESIRECELEAALLLAQAKLLDDASTRRNKDSMPLLVKQVEAMVCKVATDWKALSLDEREDQRYTIFVEYADSSKVPDHQLSAGALTLLFTAMRIVIMQEEAKRSQGFSLPLFCDDPFIQLDDARLKQAFQMLVEQAVGHQILYFTCHKRVLELAKTMGITTHEL
jgi:hypothetical protein